MYTGADDAAFERWERGDGEVEKFGVMGIAQHEVCGNSCPELFSLALGEWKAREWVHLHRIAGVLNIVPVIGEDDEKLLSCDRIGLLRGFIGLDRFRCE
jgi:hypothetical protein